MSANEQSQLTREFLEFIASNPSQSAINLVRKAISEVSRPRPLSPKSTNEAALCVFRNLAHSIMGFLNIRDVIYLGQTNADLRREAPRHILHSIHDFFRHRFTDIRGFRGLLRDTSSVISGSSVLSFISRDTTWMPADLDIYTPEGCAQTVIDWLVQCEAYVVRAPAAQPSNNGMNLTFTAVLEMSLQQSNEGPYHFARKHIRRVHKLTRPSDGACIDVIESLTTNPLTPITKFHSTVVMNYISADSIVCFYPKLTFTHRGVKHTPDRHNGSWREKYMSRGYRIFNAPYELGRGLCEDACLAVERSSEDVACLKVKIPYQGESGSGPAVWQMDGVGVEVDARWSLGTGDFQMALCDSRLCPRRLHMERYPLRP